MSVEDEDPLRASLAARQTLARFVHERRPEILSAWIQAARQRPAARDLSDADLVARVTPLLDWMAALPGPGGELPPPERIARELALARLQEGMDLLELVAQYSVLRDRLIELWRATEPLPASWPGILAIHQAIDAVVAAAVAEYGVIRDRVLNAGETVSMSTMESASLAELLERLLVAFQEVAPVIDTVAIYLLDDGLVRLHAAVGIPADQARRYALKVGEGLPGRIAAEKRALFVPDAAAEPVPLYDAPSARTIRAAYGVPLLEGGFVVGVAVMGSFRIWSLSKADRTVFETIARRASGAIYYWKVREKIDTEKARIDALLGQIPAGVILAEAPSGKMTLHNSQVELIWRRPFIASASIEDYRAWPAFRLDGRRLEPGEWALARTIRTGETVINHEVEILRGDGSRGTILSSAAPIRSPDGRIVGGVTAFVDITEKRKTEKELRETAANAQRAELVQNLIADASQKLAEAFVEGSAVPSILRLALPRLADWCAVYLTDEANERLTLAELAHTDPQRTAAVRKRLQELPVAGKAGRAAYDVFRQQKPLVFPLITDDVLVEWATSHEQLTFLRELKLASVMLMPLVARGRALGIVVFASAESRKMFTPEDLLLAKELTRRSAFAIDNEQLYEKAQQEVHLREDVLAVISHDLRNPLSAVLLNAAQLASEPLTGGQGYVLKQAETILAAARRMSRLIRDLVDFAAIGAGKLSIVRNPAEAAGIATEALGSFEEAAHRKGIVLDREIEDDLPSLSCDRERLVEVLENLISNAIKATDRGGRITVRASRVGREILFAVSDTGTGIAADELEHVFDRYYRARGTRGEGLGLGLAIAKTIVESHGGRIWAESAIGKGSEFSLAIPLAPA